MSRRCCCGSCLIYSDTFSIDADVNEVPNWREIRGEWSVAGGLLHEAGNADAIIIANKVSVGYSFKVTAATPEIIENAIYAVIGNYADESNYYCATFKWETVSGLDQKLTISLYRTNALLRSQVWYFTDVIGEGGTFEICLNDKIFYASAGVDSVATPFTICKFNSEMIDGGNKAGLGNRAAIAIDYTNFAFYETQYTLADDTCPYCSNNCGCLCDLASSLCDDGDMNLCFEMVSDCAVLNISGTLNYNYSPPTPTFPWWDWFGETGLVSSISLACDEYATENGYEFWRNYTLAITSFAAECGFAIDSLLEGSCDPFYLIFEGHVTEGGIDGCLYSGCNVGDTFILTIGCC